MGPNHPRKSTSFTRPRSGPSSGLSASTAGSRLSTSTATTRSGPLQPNSNHLFHGSAIPNSTKMGRSKKREIASCISSWLSLASLEPAKLNTIPATKAARTPLRWSSSVTPSTVREGEADREQGGSFHGLLPLRPPQRLARQVAHERGKSRARHDLQEDCLGQ